MGYVSNSFAAMSSALLLLASCSASPGPPGVGSGVASTASDAISVIVGQARDNGADDSQIMILMNDEISFTDYNQAVNQALACMQQAGIDTVGPDATDRSGITVLRYSWSPDIAGMTQDQVTALGDDCIKRFSFWVEAWWQAQPTSLEAKEKYFDRFRSAVVQCVRDNGGMIRDDATRDEALTASFAVYDKSGIDCFDQAGIDP